MPPEEIPQQPEPPVAEPTPTPTPSPQPPMPQDKDESLETMDEDETRLYEVHKHPFGLVVVFILAGLAITAIALLAMLLAPTIFPNSDNVQRGIYITTFIGILSIAVVIGLAVFTYVYRQSKLMITNKNLTKIIQQGLFHREVSELSMANVEDVRATTSGIFATLFGFGELEVETAAEDENFRFKLCPNPNFYGKIVLDARQKYLAQDGRSGRPGR